MANQRKKPTHEGGPQTRDDYSATDNELFKNLAELTPTAEPTAPVNIPVWGWPGTGKTTALLTVFHYLRADKHGVRLSRVKDDRKLAELAGLSEADTLSLHTRATDSAQELNDISDVFFSKNEWPEGTDVARRYVLEVRTLGGRSAFVLLPDIKGGSFQLFDETAASALDGASGMVLVVDAATFQEPSPKGKEYVDDIQAIIERCNHDKIPALILLTKDDSGEPDQMLDATHSTLVTLTKRLPSDRVKVARVTVIGTKLATGKQPPAAVSRNPTRLLSAWSWLLYTVLTDKPTEKRSVQSLEFAPKLEPAFRTRRELRITSEFDEPTTVVGTRQTKEFTSFSYFNRSTGAITERTFDRSGKQTANSKIDVRDWQRDDVPLIRFAANYWYIGGNSEEAIWCGPLGEPVVPGTVPTALTSWYPANGSTIVGLDQEGTLHLLRRNGTKWNSSDHLKNFIPPANSHLHADKRRVLASNGPQLEGVELLERKFGQRLVLEATSTQGVALAINARGLRLVKSANGALSAGIDTLTTLTGPCGQFALADEASAVAWLGSEGLGFAQATGGGEFMTIHTPLQLAEASVGLKLSPNAAMLAVSLESAKQLILQRMGF